MQCSITKKFLFYTVWIGRVSKTIGNGFHIFLKCNPFYYKCIVDCGKYLEIWDNYCTNTTRKYIKENKILNEKINYYLNMGFLIFLYIRVKI